MPCDADARRKILVVGIDTGARHAISAHLNNLAGLQIQFRHAICRVSGGAVEFITGAEAEDQIAAKPPFVLEVSVRTHGTKTNRIVGL